MEARRAEPDARRARVVYLLQTCVATPAPAVRRFLPNLEPPPHVAPGRFFPEAPSWRRRGPYTANRRRRMADDGLLEAVRGLHLAHPELGPKPLLAKLREQ